VNEGILRLLPADLRNKLKPLVERAGLPFHASLDSIVADFLELLVDLRHLGASLGDLAQLLAEAGVTTSNGGPIKASTLSRSLARARARETTGPQTTSREKATVGGDKGRLAALRGKPHNVASDNPRHRAERGGNAPRAGIDCDNQQQATASPSATRRSAAIGGGVRRSKAPKGEMRHSAALSDSSRPSMARSVVMHGMPESENRLRQKAAAGVALLNAHERDLAARQRGNGNKSHRSKGSAFSPDNEIGSGTTVTPNQSGTAITETFATTLHAGDLLRKIIGEPNDQEE
jgi:hypothetical protein